MPNIDIEVEPDLKELFELPPCNIVTLPEPSPTKITLPTGGSINAISDISKGIPNDCSMTFNLLVQLGPLLASMDCLLKMLKLLKPLTDVVTGLTKTPPKPPVKAVQDLATAVIDIAPCFLIPTGAPLIPFIRDILCLILKVLHCFIGQMNTIIGIMSGVQLKLNLAKEASNDELVEALECAQNNANISAQHMMQSLQPITAILDLLAPMMGLAGVQAIQFPTLGSETDLQALQQTVQTIENLVVTIQQVVDALGGCE